MPDYPAGFFILPDIRHAGLSGRRSPDIRLDIRHPAVAGYPAAYPASGIFYEKHPASGSCRISGNPAGFWMKNQTIFQALKWHLLPQTIKHVNRMPKIMYKKELELLLNVSIFFGKKSGNPASGSCRISGRISGIRHILWKTSGIRHPAKKTDPAQPYLLYIFICIIVNRYVFWKIKF